MVSSVEMTATVKQSNSEISIIICTKVNAEKEANAQRDCQWFSGEASCGVSDIHCRNLRRVVRESREAENDGAVEARYSDPLPKKELE